MTFSLVTYVYGYISAPPKKHIMMIVKRRPRLWESHPISVPPSIAPAERVSCYFGMLRILSRTEIRHHLSDGDGICRKLELVLQQRRIEILCVTR